MTINGFTFYVRNHNTATKYYEAICGEIVLTSKSLNSLIKKVKKYA